MHVRVHVCACVYVRVFVCVSFPPAVTATAPVVGSVPAADPGPVPRPSSRSRALLGPGPRRTRRPLWGRGTAAAISHVHVLGHEMELLRHQGPELSWMPTGYTPTSCKPTQPNSQFCQLHTSIVSMTIDCKLPFTMTSYHSAITSYHKLSQFVF